LVKQIIMKTQGEVRWPATERQSAQVQPSEAISMILRAICQCRNAWLNGGFLLAGFEYNSVADANIAGLSVYRKRGCHRNSMHDLGVVTTSDF
jgi:hypothetical protein